MTNFYKRITGSTIQGDESTVIEQTGTIVINTSGAAIIHDGVTVGGNPFVVLKSNGTLTIPGAISSNEHPGNITINSNNGITTSTWTFGADGRLELPGDIPAYYTPTKITLVDTTATDVVVFEYTSDQHTAKLILQVEGFEGNMQGWDTQSCEMIVAKSFKHNKVAASVYGLVHTSDAPLATFDAQYNSITNTIQVTCTPTATVFPNYALYVVAFGTTVSTSD